MTVKKLFISHSSKTDENKVILDHVCQSLETLPGIKILVDKKIQAENEWFPELYEYMWECHGAVIFLSDAALKSEWVKAEAAVMCARKRCQAGFKLLLVALDNVDPKNFDKHRFFKTIRVGDFQTVSHDNTADEISKNLSKYLEDFRSAETPFDEMVRRITGVLRPIEANDKTRLEDALTRLNPDFKFDSNDNAERLTRFLLRDSNNIFQSTRELLTELSNVINKGQAQNIVEIVKGYWVHPGAASNLAKIRHEQGAVAINGIEVGNFTGDCYARQAWPEPQPYKVISLSGFERDIQKIEETLFSKVLDQTIPPRLRKKALADIADPLLLVFPYPDSNDFNTQSLLFPDESFLDEIKANLSNVTVLLSTGPDIPPFLNYVTVLEPLLQLDEEDNQLIQRSKVENYIQSHLKG